MARPLRASMLLMMYLAATAAPADAGPPDDNNDGQYFAVYRVVAEFQGPNVYTDGEPIDSPTGLQRTVWCTSCTSTKAWIWTADHVQEANTVGAVDPSQLGAAIEDDFKTLVFDYHAEVLVLPCTLNGKPVADCYIASGSAAWLTVSDTAPPPHPCPPPGWCPVD